MVHQVSSPGYIDLKWSNLAHSLQKLAFLDPFWTLNWLFRALKNIFVPLMLQIHLWPHFPWHRPKKMVHQMSSPAWKDLKWLNLAYSSSKLAFLDPKFTCYSPKIYIFWCLICFKSYSGQISYDLDQKNGSSSEFSRLFWPWMIKFS